MTTQNTPSPNAPKPQATKKRKHLKGWLALLLAVLVCAALVLRGLLGTKEPKSEETAYTTEQVQVRTITNVLTSSGTLEPADAYTVSTLVSGEVLGDTFAEGDMVEKGQLLYTLDSCNAAASQTQAQSS